ncbi:uncharacterized protein LOC108628431 [Ceratina calcarata]|uniref:Uncharacterized protein LOC108628431 n=1 Tax=Ceratina calcarata TaxID=156304 RepID=A0AAJ7S7S5_9HYME|nr:uncharacterized protein LOC108628431 [Ceratina calcarata]
MMYKLMTIFTSCFILILYARSSTAKALTPEDVEGLLPPDPRDKNETIAAVVQDPVVQDAVHNAVNNGSLNGLVVKKHVFIMPATDPKTVLSKREHLLVVPTENLEDVRKNITEVKQAEARETSTAGNQAFFEEYASEYTPEEDENREERDELSEKRKSGTEFLKNELSHGSALLEPEDTEKKIAVPIVAVIDPTNADKGKVKSPIVAILPNQPIVDVPVNNQVQFLKDNSDRIQKEAQDFVDGSSLTVNTNYYWKPTPEIASPPGSSPISLYVDEVVPSLATEAILTPVVVPQWNLVPLTDDQGEETELGTTVIRNEVD